MGYRKRSSKEAMPRPKPDGRCKKHPKHKQSPGVCSICLSEKLSQLSTTSSHTSSSAAMDSASSSSSLTSHSLSSYSSSYSSPMHRFRYNTHGKRSLSFLVIGKNVLTKSRSLVFVSRNRDNQEKIVDKKKDGFLSKFLRPRNKKIQEGLVHSRTMRERVINITRVI